MRRSWAVMGHLGAVFGPCGAILSWSSWERLVTVLETILTALEAILNHVSRLGGHLGPSWNRLGALLRASWAVLGASWGHVSRLGGHLGPSWANLRAILAVLEAILDHLGAIWSRKNLADHLWAILGGLSGWPAGRAEAPGGVLLEKEPKPRAVGFSTPGTPVASQQGAADDGKRA